jgi:hypothetical protein
MAAQTKPLDIEAFTIDQFCLAHGISKRHFYDLKNAGKAPRLMQIDRSIRIARDAAADWRREREAEAAARNIKPKPNAPATGARPRGRPRKVVAEVEAR